MRYINLLLTLTLTDTSRLPNQLANCNSLIEIRKRNFMSSKYANVTCHELWQTFQQKRYTPFSCFALFAIRLNKSLYKTV